MDRTRRPAPPEFAPYYEPYVARVPEGDVVETLATQLAATLDALRRAYERHGDGSYAEGKWSAKEVAGHLADTERIFAYRILRIGRGDATPLASFEENAYVQTGDFNRRPLDEVLAELAAARESTLALLRGLPAAAWSRKGTASGWEVSLPAIAWITAGHELHHRAVVEERYLSSAAATAAGSAERA